MVLLSLVFGVSCVYLWVSCVYLGFCRFAVCSPNSKNLQAMWHFAFLSHIFTLFLVIYIISNINFRGGLLFYAVLSPSLTLHKPYSALFFFQISAAL